jgi:hypothetical protein
MGHLIEITVFLVSISAVLLVSGLIVAKTYFPPKSNPLTQIKKLHFGFKTISYSTAQKPDIRC